MLLAYPETQDHPRLRGEQFILTIRLAFTSGSPPLARGTGSVAALRSARAGITPACAGNSVAEIFQKPVEEDHPRLRGEQQ